MRERAQESPKYMACAFPNKTVAEFFAGIGLMRIGLERAGWRVAFSNDIDEDKRRMYADHFGDDPTFILKDVHLLEALPIFRPLPSRPLHFRATTFRLLARAKGLLAVNHLPFGGLSTSSKKWGRTAARR